MSILGDPVPMVVSFDQVFQLLGWPGDVSVTKGKVVIFGYFVHMMVPPLLSRPLIHFKGGAVGLDMDKVDTRVQGQVT
jgi:hypothetical protein